MSESLQLHNVYQVSASKLHKVFVLLVATLDDLLKSQKTTTKQTNLASWITCISEINHLQIIVKFPEKKKLGQSYSMPNSMMKRSVRKTVPRNGDNLRGRWEIIVTWRHFLTDNIKNPNDKLDPLLLNISAQYPTPAHKCTLCSMLSLVHKGSQTGHLVGVSASMFSVVISSRLSGNAGQRSLGCNVSVWP